MYNLYKLFICSVQIFLFTLTIASASFATTVSIRADKNDFPVAYMRSNHWEGMDIELIEGILTRANIDYRIDDIPFKRSLIQTKEGKNHIIPNLTKNEERSKYMHWLGPTRFSCIGLVVQKKHEELSINTVEDLIKAAKQTNKKIGYLAGASYSKAFDQQIENDPNLKDILHILPNKSQHLEMLKLGRIFGYFHDVFEVQQRMQDKIFAPRYIGLAINPYQIEDSCMGAYIGISKKLDEKIYLKIQNSFDSMKRDGSFAKIHLKWRGTQPNF